MSSLWGAWPRNSMTSFMTRSIVAAVAPCPHSRHSSSSRPSPNSCSKLSMASEMPSLKRSNASPGPNATSASSNGAASKSPSGTPPTASDSPSPIARPPPPARPPEPRIVVARVHVAKPAARVIQLGVEAGHELPARGRAHDGAIHLLDEHPGREPPVGARPHRALHGRHEQRRRHALARDVGDHHHGAVGVDREVVVEIPAHLLGRDEPSLHLPAP